MANLVIEVEPELERQICEAAKRRGVNVSDLVRPVLQALVNAPDAGLPRDGVAVSPTQGAVQDGSPRQRPIWEVAATLLQDVPEEELRRLPPDLAQNLDHYLYGAPKKE